VHYVHCMQEEMSVHNRSNYEGLDPADVSRLQAPPAPHHYAGLDIQSPRLGAGLDRHGYIQVIADPDNDRDRVQLKRPLNYRNISNIDNIDIFHRELFRIFSTYSQKFLANTNLGSN